MLVELDRPASDPSTATDDEDIRALSELCRFVASECHRLNLGSAERSALSLASEIARYLVRHCH